jgi:asparagine synthase (glutamine-hydrolysing)
MRTLFLNRKEGTYMCGIAGWIDYNRKMSEEQDVLIKMSGTLEKRGPDEGAIYNSPNASLIHRRLIVIDPENGKQPMAFKSENENYIIVYNGELYNADELRKELINIGFEFDGHCDTEVLLKAYVQWGESCPEKLNGIYAFAVWHEKEQRLFMARDRMGVKPLFYYPYNEGIIFASEIKALLRNPLVEHKIDNEGLKEVLLLAPGRTQGNGIIKSVKEVLPGEFVTFSRSGMNKHKYWSLKAAKHEDDLATTIEKTKFLITDSIKRQLVSDVPLCCFLSGGLDSSIISKLASDHYKETGKGRITTYSVDYTDNDKYFVKSTFQPNADSEYINTMVDAIQSEHRSVILTNEELMFSLEAAADARDLPGMADIDSSLLLFSKEIKKEFTVAVSGECADEVFAGYPWYHNKEILFADCFPWTPSNKLRKHIIKEGIINDADEFIYERYKSTVNATDKLSDDSEIDARMREMFMLNLNWFMQTLLDRKDRMTMYNGLEVRVPFCDHRIVEYAYNMPWDMKALNGREKGIVREAMRGVLPDEILWRKKSPYPKTHNPIYFSLVSQKVKEILDNKESMLSQLVNKQAIYEIIENPDGVETPWYGQLMRAPQMLAYLIQLEYWFNKNRICIV